MLKAPVRRIGGYGTVKGYREMTVNEAWDAYGTGNGRSTPEELLEDLGTYRSKRAPMASGYTIGCIELEAATFLSPSEYVDVEQAELSFPSQIVKYKTFRGVDTLSPVLGSPVSDKPFRVVAGTPDRKEIAVKDRKGQAQFRRMVLDQYDNRCCVTGESEEALLEAAHIQPYINQHSHHPQNGLCLRIDLHRLFDAGLISVSSQLEVLVSSKLSSPEYRALAGKSLRLPLDRAKAPALDAISEHRLVFRA